MKALRIAVWHNLPSGGGKRQLYNHVQGLIDRGHYVESWCPDTADQKYLPLSRLVQEHIIPIAQVRHAYDYPVRPWRVVQELLTSMQRQALACAKEIGRGRFDVLYAGACLYLRTTAIARYLQLPSALYLGEPYRWFYEAMPELPWLAPRSTSAAGSWLGNKVSWQALRKLLGELGDLQGMRLQARAELEYARGFDQLLVNSVYSRETMLRTYALEARVCYLGIDTDLYKPTGEAKEPFVVGLGTLCSSKGVDRAIRAIGTIDRAKRPALIWIGNGAPEPELQQYRDLARELEVSFIPKVHIPDEEVISLLSRAQVMLYTSRLEPFGLAPLEANACGTPVVGIAEGGVRESVKDGTSGYLIGHGDPQALGQLVQRFVDNPALSADMGSKARAYVKESWSLSRATDNIEAALVSLSRQTRGSAPRPRASD